jgi:hypothetical protein
MWENRGSLLLAPLPALISTKVPYVWTDEHQKNFDAIACKTQIGAVLYQNGKPVAFYSTKYCATWKKIIVAGALSRLEIDDDKEIFDINECFGYDDGDLPPSSFPIRNNDMAEERSSNPALLLKLRSNKAYSESTFREGDQKSRTELSSRHHPDRGYYTPTFRPEGSTTPNGYRHLSKSLLCQRAKTTNQKYGKLPAKLAEENPWDTLCVDLIGPYKIQRKRKTDIKLWYLPMIDPATGWFEMEQFENKTAAEVANICETTWFTRYPLPQRITLDRGTKFTAEFARIVKNDNGLKSRRESPSIEAQNSRQNSPRWSKSTAEFAKMVTKMTTAWHLQFAARATYNTTLPASPIQFVFGRDAILNVKHISNWEHIRRRKQTRINMNNKREKNISTRS